MHLRSPPRRIPQARGVRRALLAPLALGATALLLAGCGPDDRTLTLGPAQPVSEAPPPAAGTDEQRLGRGVHGGGAGHGMEQPEAGRRWVWTTPAGWKDMPAREMTLAVWQGPGAAPAECTFSTLPGRAGGLLMNVNRWRKQMGQPPIDEAGLAALPRARFLGASAVRLDLEGTYVGMGGTPPVPGARFLGLLVELPGALGALRLSGSAEAVAAAEPGFSALAESIRMEQGGAAGPEDLPPAPTGETPLAWTLPEGWEVRPNPSGGIRLATFGLASTKDAEITLTVLGGGVRPNIDLWRSQLGIPPLSDAEFAGLERGPVLGGEGVYCSLRGRIGRLGDAPAQLLGMVAERGRVNVFVKLTGPEKEVEGERQRFRAFCESLRE